VVPLSGLLEVDGTEVAADTVARLDGGTTLVVTAQGPTSFMLLAGEPIGEPIAHYGPFVMNTPAEIEEAIRDYQEGRMGRLG